MDDNNDLFANLDQPAKAAARARPADPLVQAAAASKRGATPQAKDGSEGYSAADIEVLLVGNAPSEADTGPPAPPPPEPVADDAATGDTTAGDAATDDTTVSFTIERCGSASTAMEAADEGLTNSGGSGIASVGGGVPAAVAASLTDPLSTSIWVVV